MADFVTKEIALANFSPYDPVELLGGFLRLTLVFNSGAAFSIGTGVTWVFSLVMIGVILYILWMSRKLYSAWWAVSLGLILSGATGNFIDRLWRPDTRELSAALVGPEARGTLWERLLSPPSPLNGHVVDWIQLPNYPVFNIADSGIVCGGVLTVVLAFRGINIDGTRESGGPGKTGPAESAARPATEEDGRE
ncbi:signal peptidase II [Actinorugispora endophytica]|uniref:Lipoprotein signal peptidase n=1 Tax=Actinorugispora endophytica TaxID=1605990 RepID=A0A4R6UCE0_9ACTN|nr:signal peptidase II [Actinorugispora endophytica]